MCDPFSIISGLGSIFGALASKPPKPPKPELPARAATVDKAETKIELGGSRASDTARKKKAAARQDIPGSRSKASLNVSKRSGINIL